MQRCNVTVRLGGDVRNSVALEAISVAHIAVLLDLHGEGSVLDIQPVKMCKTPHGTERAMLVEKFGMHVIDRLFPGQFAKLPVTLAEVVGGPAEPEEDEDADVVETDADTAADTVVDTAEDVVTVIEDEDDKALRTAIAEATSKQQLYTIAKDNDVSLTGVADKMDDLRAAILAGAFGGGE